MATALSITRDNIIEAALRRAGVLAAGNTPSSSELADAAEVLNAIVKSYDAAPWFKWFIKSEPLSFNTTNGTESYILSPQAMWVESMVVKESTLFSPLTLLTVGEYAHIQSRGVRVGIPTHAFISTDNETPKAFLYPVPNAVFTVNYWIRRKADIFDNSSDTGDFPPEWYHVLIWKLALELAFEYGRPIQIIDRIALALERAENTAMGNQTQQITGQEITKPSLMLNSPREEPSRKVLPVEAFRENDERR